MSRIQKLKEANLNPETIVRLKYEDGLDVIHSNDDFIDNVIQSTYITGHLTDLVLNPLLGNNQILAEMREQGLLDPYERGSFDFEGFVSEVVEQNWSDYDWIEASTEAFDHKRGFTTVSATIETTTEAISKMADFELIGWKIEVDHPLGILELDE